MLNIKDKRTEYKRNLDNLKINKLVNKKILNFINSIKTDIIKEFSNHILEFIKMNKIKEIEFFIKVLEAIATETDIKEATIDNILLIVYNDFINKKKKKVTDE